MKIRDMLLVLLVGTLSGCTSTPINDKEVGKVYDNEYAVLNETIDWDKEVLKTFVADYTFNTTSEEALYNNSKLVLEGEFLGIVEAYVDNMGMINTVYDFRVGKDYKGSDYNEGDIIQVAMLGGVLEYGEYKETLISLGREQLLEQKSEAFIREKYDEEEANRIIAQMEKGLADDDLVVQSFYSNPLSDDEHSYLLFLGDSDEMGVFTPVALNNGYKIVGKDGMVSSVGNPDEVTPVFSIAKLASLQKVTD